MNDKERWLGPCPSTAEYMFQITTAGFDDLQKARKALYDDEGDGAKRIPKTWSAKPAAALIGKSDSWLRTKDPDNPLRNASGHTVWTLERLLRVAEDEGALYKRPDGSSCIVLSMAKFKGGVGISTATCHLAHGLAMRGLKVLCVDMDPQASMTQVLASLVPDDDLIEEDLPIDALINDPALIATSGIVRQTFFTGVDIVPSNTYLNKVDAHLSMCMSNGEIADESGLMPAERLDAMLEVVKPSYDVILVDCPPNLGSLTTNALYAADGLITCIRPELFDRSSLISFTESVGWFSENSKKELDYFRILLSQSSDSAASIGPANARATQEGNKKNNQERNHLRNELMIRDLYGDAVMMNNMKSSKAISEAVSNFNTVFSMIKPQTTRPTWERGIQVASAVVEEVYEDLKLIWSRQVEGLND